MLALKNITAGYSENPLIDVGNLEVAAGEVFVLIGASGCGKTTLFKAISGLLPLTSGEVILNGKTKPSYIKSRISQTLQGFPLFPWLTVEENLTVAARLKGIDQIDAKGILNKFQANHIAKKYPSDISGGEKCRASIAQAMVSKPKLLLLDEPFVGLDTLTKKRISENLFGFCRENQIATMVVTHDIHHAIEYADRLGILVKRSNEIAKIGEIFADPQNSQLPQILKELEKGFRE